MPTINYRGWSFVDEASAPDLESPRGKAIQARADALMAEWSQIHHEQEQKAFRQFEDNEDYDPRSCECGEESDEDPDELCIHDRHSLEVFEASEALETQGKVVRLQLIEAELTAMGVRKKRAYEHWNEDEAYMQWMEEGRFGQYTD